MSIEGDRRWFLRTVITASAAVGADVVFNEGRIIRGLFGGGQMPEDEVRRMARRVDVMAPTPTTPVVFLEENSLFVTDLTRSTDLQSGLGSLIIDSSASVSELDSLIIESQLSGSRQELLQRTEVWDTDNASSLQNVIAKRLFADPLLGYTLRQNTVGSNGENNRFAMHAYSDHRLQRLLTQMLWFGEDLIKTGNPPFYAPFPGTVTNIGLEPKYGRYIDIYSPNKAWATRLHHTDNYVVNVGDTVQAGQHLGFLEWRNHIHAGLVFRANRPLTPVGQPLDWIVVPLSETHEHGASATVQQGATSQLLLPEDYFAYMHQLVPERY